MEAILIELIEVVKDWPVIVQGALGSGLFWIILLIAQKSFDFGVSYLSKHSKQQRSSWLVSRYAKLKAFGGSKDKVEAVYSISAVSYRSLRPLYKGFMWLSLGLITYPFNEFGIAIGGIGAVYFFLKAYEVVSPINSELNTAEEIRKVHQELVELGVIPAPEPQQKTNKSIQPTANASAD